MNHCATKADGTHITGPNREILVDRYYNLMDRMSRNPWPDCKQLLTDKMHVFLTAVKQQKAAEKFIKHHTGEWNGNWMWCDAGYGGVNNNNSPRDASKELAEGYSRFDWLQDEQRPLHWYAMQILYGLF